MMSAIDPTDPLLVQPIVGRWLAFHEVLRDAEGRPVAVNDCFVALDGVVALKLFHSEQKLQVRTSKGYEVIDLGEVYTAFTKLSDGEHYDADEKLNAYIGAIFAALAIPVPAAVYAA